MQKPEVLIVGHKNPDTDSVCAAYCYAELKNRMDEAARYVPAVCGTLNSQTGFVFENAGVKPPVYVKDVYPRVSHIARRDGMRLHINAPVYDAAREIDKQTISAIPVFADSGAFAGVIGINEVSRYFIMDGINKRPSYIIRTDNLNKVLPGYFWQRGQREEFSAQLMIGAMTYESSKYRIDKLAPEKPVLVIGLREKIIRYAVECALPAIILTGISDRDETTADFKDIFKNYHGAVYVSSKDTAETIRLMRLSVPVKQIMNESPLTLKENERFDKAREIILNSEFRGLPVMNGTEFAGIVTRRSFIEKPRQRIILVDHNELSQSVNGAEEAEVMEIIDHHRLAPEKTSNPIYVFSKPVGSTCTIILQHFKMHKMDISRRTALLLLAGVLSDTLNLKSPTTTVDDRIALKELSAIAGVEVESYFNRMLSCMTVLKDAPAAEVVNGDFKKYTGGGFSAGIAQVEVITLADVPESRERLLAALEDTCRRESLHWAMLLITDVIHETSYLLCTSFPAGEELLPYGKLSENIYNLPGILSRKKQLLPVILHILSTLAGDS